MNLIGDLSDFFSTDFLSEDPLSLSLDYLYKKYHEQAKVRKVSGKTGYEACFMGCWVEASEDKARSILENYFSTHCLELRLANNSISSARLELYVKGSQKESIPFSRN